MSDVGEVVAKAQKKHGDKIGGFGGGFPGIRRLPTGILAFDLASGGGIPLSRMTMVYGPESSGKTNFALSCVASYQRIYPDRPCTYIDIEMVTPEDWMASMGVDVPKLVLLRPDYAEQVIDIVEGLLSAENCGLVVIDSIAAMCTMQELSKDAEGESPGTHPRAVGKLVRRCTRALGEADKAGGFPTTLWINQVRSKIGVMFGNPETMPGGHAQKFMASMRVRLAGKNVMDNTVSNAMPVLKQTSGVIQKWKCAIYSQQFRYDMVMIPHAGRCVGECIDLPIVKQYVVPFGWLQKGKGGYVFTPTGAGPFKTHADFGDWLGEGDNLPAVRDLILAELSSGSTTTTTEAG